MGVKLSDEVLKSVVNKLLRKSGSSLSNKWEDGKKYKTKSGVKVRSKIEKIILDLYFDLGIEVEYEKKILFPKAKGKEKFTVYCDFYLPEYDIYHEHFGLEDSNYLKMRKIKTFAFQRHKMKFISTSVEDELDIKGALLGKLRGFGIVKG